MHRLKYCRKERLFMVEKTCCVTGHRDIPEARIAYVEQELRREVEEAIAEGYTRFISGFAEGVDLMFAARISRPATSVPNQNVPLGAWLALDRSA